MKEGEGNEESDPRDVRKQLDELQSRKDEASKPEDGEDEPTGPRDPEQRGEGEPDEAGDGPSAADRAPAWMVNLPPQIRNAWVRGDFDKIPPEYRKLIERYLIWLNRAASEEGPATGDR